MKYYRFRAFLVGAALATTTPSAATAQHDDFSLSGDRVAVYNLAGDVTIERGTGSEVTLTVTTGGDDRDQLTFQTGPICGANALRIVYPDDDIVYPGYRGNTEVEVRRDGTFYGHRNWHRNYDWGCSTGRRDRRDRIRIDGRGRGLEAYADVSISVPAGKTIEIYLAAGSVSASNLNGTLIVDAGAADIEATDVEGEVLIDTGSGSIDVDRGDGVIILDTGSGRVEVNEITGDLLIVDTGSGGVRGSGINVANLNIDTGSGSVDVDRVQAPEVLIDTGSGSITLDHSGPLESLSVDTGSGSVDVTLDSSLDARIEIDTGSGGIDVDFPLSVSRWRRSHVNGVVGDGTGRVLIDTGSGGVTLRQR